MRETAALIAEWEDLLTRRPAFRESLGLYGTVLEAWSRWSPEGCPVLRWGVEQCRERWERGVALIREAPPAFNRDALEPLFAPLLEELAALGEATAEAVSRFAAAWDEGRVSPSDLFPGLPTEGGEAFGISPDLLSLVTYLGLRPPLEAYFAEVLPVFSGDFWDAGSCPFCAGAPSFGDFGEDGKRWLSCALCGGRWTIGRLRCPFCDNRDAKTLTRLAAEDKEEGYLIEACDLCRGYLKGVDRRVRWNAASATIEDWGTPHLDLIASRRGYRRATPSLIRLVSPGG